MICVYLLVDCDLTKEDFFITSDKQNLSNHKKSLENVFKAITYNHNSFKDKIISSGIKFFIREENTNYNYSHKQVIVHFNLK